MKIAILSLSSLVQRKILPALSKLSIPFDIDIYTRRKSVANLPKLEFPNLVFTFKHRSCFDSTTIGLYSFVYISSANSNHSEDIEACYLYNHHTLIDKPAFLDYIQCAKYVSLFKQRQLYLVEVVVWQYHSQVNFFRDFIARHRDISAISLFLIPELDVTNFRVQSSSLGSGVFNDMNAYAFSLADFLGIPKRDLSFHFPHDNILNNNYFTVNSKFSGLIFYGIFGFGFPYVNSLLLTSGSSSLYSDRIFTSSTDISPSLNLKEATHHTNLSAIDDMFFNFIFSFINTLQSNPIPNSDSYERLLSKYTHPCFKFFHD